MVDSHAEDEVDGRRRSTSTSPTSSPACSLVFEFTTAGPLFANAHTTFRAPQIFDYDFTKPGPGLDFEHGTTLSSASAWDHCRGLSGSVALWQVDYSDFIESTPYRRRHEPRRLQEPRHRPRRRRRLRRHVAGGCAGSPSSASSRGRSPRSTSGPTRATTPFTCPTGSAPAASATSTLGPYGSSTASTAASPTSPTPTTIDAGVHALGTAARLAAHVQSAAPRSSSTRRSA